jgi:hypothetical protein
MTFFHNNDEAIVGRPLPGHETTGFIDRISKYILDAAADDDDDDGASLPSLPKHVLTLVGSSKSGKRTLCRAAVENINNNDVSMSSSISLKNFIYLEVKIIIIIIFCFFRLILVALIVLSIFLLTSLKLSRAL